MRKILVLTDFSENSTNALKYACELFKHDISKFIIMHAYQDEIYTDDSLITRGDLENVTKNISAKSKSQLEDILKQIKSASQNAKHSYIIKSSNSMLLDETNKIVEDENIDIIVMGTHGKAKDNKLTFGSHTLQVLRYVCCPVLAIPENFEHKHPKHILFSTDYLIPYKKRELKLLNDLASSSKAIIDVLYISRSRTLSLRQEDNQNFIKEVLGQNKINFTTLNAKSISKTIHEYINEYEVDMLVMVNTRHSFLENILFQTTIDKVSLNVDIPFLALQNMNRNQ